MRRNRLLGRTGTLARLVFGYAVTGKSARPTFLRTSAATFRFGLPAGYGFQWEIKITDTTDNASQPILDKMILSFSE